MRERRIRHDAAPLDRDGGHGHDASAGDASASAVHRPRRAPSRLARAAAHIERAIRTVNDEAQVRVPAAGQGDGREVERLRQIVRALADIRDGLTSRRRDDGRAGGAPR